MATKKKPQININPPEHIVRIYKALRTGSVLSGPKVCEAGFVYLLANPQKMNEAIETLLRFEGAASSFETDEQCAAFARRFQVTAAPDQAVEAALRRASAPRRKKSDAAPKKETAGG